MKGGECMKLRILAIAAALAALLSAQTESRLTGTVTDGSGSAVAAAEVTATNMATGVAYRKASNDTGTYVFPALPPGPYRLSCQASGFKRSEQAGIVLDTGFVRTVDVRLDVGQVTETVEVQASTPLLDTENATVGQLVGRSTLLNMPMASRRTGSLVRLVGAVAFRDEGGGAEQLPFFTMGGGRARNQNWQLDGMNIQNNAIGNAQMLFNPPSETVEEFKVELSNYSADLGRSGGGFIQITTRAGTNQFHGAAYEFLRNDKLDARTFFAAGKAPLRYNIFGATLGGPIARNRTFFFFNYEGARYRIGQTLASDEVPHPADRDGNFSARRDVTVMNLASRQPFPGNIIPASRLDPIARELVKFYPLPNVAGSDPTRAPRDNFAANGVDLTDINWYTTRIDHNLNDRNRLFGRFIVGRSVHDNVIAYPERIADPRGEFQDPRSLAIGVSWHRSLRPTLFNELRFSVVRAPQTQTSFGNGSGVNGRLNIRGVNPDFFPRVRHDGYAGLGGNNQHFRVVERDTVEFADHLTWVRGAHHIRMGANLRYSRFLNESDTASGGFFNFNARSTNESLAAFLLGWTSNAQFLDGEPVIGRTDYWAAFIADDWKITSKLTLNIGLRWDLDTPLWRKNNLLSRMNAGPTNPVSGTPGIMEFAPFSETGKYSSDFDKNNFSPRLGFAWRPAGALVLRGGYGLFYNGPFLNVAGISVTGFNQQADFVSPDGGFTPAFQLRNGIPPPPANQQLGPGFGAVPAGAATLISPDFIQRHHVNGYHHQFNLSVQRQIFGNLLLEAGYMGNLGHKIVGSNININMIPLVNGRGPAAQNQRLRPFPQYNNVTHVGPPWGNSNYHALNLRAEKRYSAGLSFLSNFTWSKFIDDIDATSELGLEAPYQHVELRRLDRSLAGSHMGRRLIASAVYDLPFGKGRKFPVSNAVLAHIVGGWSAAVIGEARDGPVYGVTEVTNRSNAFSNSQRPNLLRNPSLDTGRSRGERVLQYFDTSAFQDPGVGVFGNSPRAICCGPGLVLVDLSAQKWFHINERWRIQFRADMENMPNRPNFNLPARARGAGDFGRISSLISTARRIQMALRLEF
ncbi:MAG: hypothetical protein FJW39_23830 [Acidobacteria bacterium]|nr:hypothetical protein [Acidobacteriota bacterium]